ncbi:peptidylprolyl isomerase [Patescibacteria group bacterium]|nr:peptidylprolyl isomerase [Patescibacteria group bacterium]
MDKQDKEIINNKSAFKEETGDQQMDLPEARKAVLEEIENITSSKMPEKSRKPAKTVVGQPSNQSQLEESTEKKEVKKATKSCSFIKAVLISLLLIIIAGIVLLLIGLYLGKWQGPIVDKLTKIVPLPVAYVNGKAIKIHTFNSDVSVLDRYLNRYSQKVSEKDLRKKTMETLVELEVINQLAEKSNVSVTEEELQSKLDDLFMESVDEQRAEGITKNLFGWNFRTFAEKILKPLLLAKKVEQYFYETSGVPQIKQRMNEIHKILEGDQREFSKIAKEVNEDKSAVAGGDLGWLNLGETAPEFELQLLQLEPGEISPVVETRFGYHIIELKEKLNTSDDKPTFHASHIFIKKPSFEDYLAEQINRSRVVTLIRF